MKLMTFSNHIGYKGILIVILLFSTEIALSQLDPSEDPVARTLPRIISPTGDAAALGRYCEYPVDISTGVPSIQIPIYTIQGNGIELPISISYHASGNKVDDISSVVGLGWALNAGGCITRTVKSEADKNPAQRDYLTMEEIDATPLSERNCVLYSLENQKNLESDIYSFNFNGYQGQFRYDLNGNLVLSTYEDLKISGSPETGYNILTPDGTQYIFSDGDEVRVMFKTYKSSWYLNKIISTTSDTITLTYNFDPLWPTDRTISFMCNAKYPNDWKFISYTENLKIQYLDNIKFKNGTVKFNYLTDRKDMRKRRLESIDVNDYKATPIKKINLTQSYFEADGCNLYISSDLSRYYYRLKLDNVSIVNPVNSVDAQLYRFDYNARRLPPYFSSLSTTPDIYYSQDYWGYFNGAVNTHMLPVESPCGLEPADRKSNGIYMQACILNKIFYPTGGRTEYEYEANTSRGNVELVGGLRITSIKGFADNLSTSPSLVKSYTYDSGGWTSSWWSDMMVDKWRFVNLADGISPTYTSTPIGPITFCGGPIVLYPTVNEFSGPKMHIKTQYNYEVVTEERYMVRSSLAHCWAGGLHPPLILYQGGYNGPQLEHHRFTHYWKDATWQSGQLASRIDYKFVNGNYEPVEEVHNTWTSYLKKDNVVGLVLVPLHPNNMSCSTQGVADCMYQYFNVLFESGVKKLTKTKTKLYTDNGIVEKTMDYEYNKIENPQIHGFKTKMSFIDDFGTTQIKNYKYALDYPSTTLVNTCDSVKKACLAAALSKSNQMLSECDQYTDPGTHVTCVNVYTSLYNNEITQCQSDYDNCMDISASDQQIITEMKNKNMINTIIEEQSVQISPNNTISLKDGTINKYIRQNGLLVPSEVYKLEINSPSTNLGFSSFNSSGSLIPPADYRSKLTFDKYDTKGNILQYHKKGDVNSAFLWGYNQTYPVVKGENVTYDLLNAAVVAAGGGNVETFWAGFSAIATNPSQQAAWKNFNTALRNNASLANAQVTTYTYTPLVGMTSQTDPNGLTTYFEYDGFGRLKNVKDKDGNILKSYNYHYKN